MKQYADDFPLNASILVDYKTNDVKFVYPNDHKDKGRFLFFVLMMVLQIWMYLFFGLEIIKQLLIYWPFILLSIQHPVYQPPESFWETIRGFAFLYLLIAIPLMVSQFIALNYSKFNTVFPKMNYHFIKLLRRKKQVFVSKIDSTVFEVHTFQNVFMEYEATEEFSTYLEKVEVLPYNFSSKDKKGKITNNESFWFARFTFSSIPTKGDLTIEYI